ncbi:MAG: stalk domain-containing protein [Firmicutes bacterium]|nr:stalk domain-containing protein [Bacillota bacterium]
MQGKMQLKRLAALFVCLMILAAAVASIGGPVEVGADVPMARTFRFDIFNNGEDGSPSRPNAGLAEQGLIRMWTQLDGANAPVYLAAADTIEALDQNGNCAEEFVRIGRLWQDGTGWLDYFNMLDVNKDGGSWRYINLTITVYGQAVHVLLVNALFEEPVLPVFSFDIFNNGEDGSPSRPNAGLAEQGLIRMWTQLDGVNAPVYLAAADTIEAFDQDGNCAEAFVRVGRVWQSGTGWLDYFNMIDVDKDGGSWRYINLTITVYGQVIHVLLVNANYTPQPPPTLYLTVNAVTISDTNLYVSVHVGGTATGPITLTYTAPAGICVTLVNDEITVNATRPAAGEPDINTKFTITVLRGGTEATITVNVDLTAEEAVPVLFSITVTGGTASPSGTAAEGVLVTLTPDTPPAGYEFYYWTVNDVRIEGNTFAMPAADVEAAAVWKAIEVPPPPIHPQPPITVFPPIPLPSIQIVLPEVAPQPPIPWRPRRPQVVADTEVLYEKYESAPYEATEVYEYATDEPIVLILIFTEGRIEYLLNDQVRISVGEPFIDVATDRMMIPLRTFAEALGVEVDWDSATRSALVHLPSGTLTVPADEMLPDGMGSVIIVDDRVFIPLRFVMYAFDAEVEWDSANRSAVIAVNAGKPIK